MTRDEIIPIAVDLPAPLGPKNAKISPFFTDKFIFSRAQRFKIDNRKNTRSWRLKLVFGGQKLAMMSILEAKKTIWEAKMAILEAKKPILEARKAAHHLTC